MAAEPPAPLRRSLLQQTLGFPREVFDTVWPLLTVMIPTSLAVRLLQETGLIEWIGLLLAPVMELAGLPGTMGLVWATTFSLNIYAGMVAYAALLPDPPLTVGQVTVLATMMLVCHSLPIELRICQRAGARIRFLSLLRLGGAFLLGVLLHHIFRLGGWLEAPRRPLLDLAAPDNSWGGWLLNEAQTYVKIFLIVAALLLLLKFLKRLRITDLLEWMLHPFLRLLGIGREAVSLTLVGMTMGISYGGGLIIRESRAGHVGDRDVFYALVLMSLSHSLIEDTLLMAAIGGHQSGIVWGRLLFSFAVTFLLVRLLGRLSESFFYRFCFRRGGADAPEAAAVPPLPRACCGVEVSSGEGEELREEEEVDGPHG